MKPTIKECANELDHWAASIHHSDITLPHDDYRTRQILSAAALYLAGLDDMMAAEKERTPRHD